ncbi:d-4,5 unsaturated-glucuronyl hydrolase-like protein [Mucidula mucida]|nr:d-4,5 unsaturated-glucuronyl hydrolase-like protein [Mucidula mucida]
MLFLSLLVSALLGVVQSQSAPRELYSSLIFSKSLSTVQSHSTTSYPQQTTRTGTWQNTAADSWTSGFFPAMMYELNKRKALCPSEDASNTNWRTLGQAWSTALIPLGKSNSVGHDVGFLSFPFVDELALNSSNETAIAAINSFATYLANRYNPVVGCTRSWDSSDPNRFTVIIDNMMNLEVLYVSASLTGNDTLRQIARKHADTTMNNHIRADGSTWHVLIYNGTTGGVISKITNQGYADNSTWSRGQSWGVYGFANMYRLTGDTNYLSTSRRLATWFIDHLPADGVVPWDFDAPNIPNPRPADSSAAGIVSNGLLLLAQLETDGSLATKWRNAALGILDSITDLAWAPSWQSLLSNATANWPQNNYLTGLVYGDYYYIKAGNELLAMNLTTC